MYRRLLAIPSQQHINPPAGPLLSGLPYLPGCEARRAHEVAARLDLDVFVVLGADFTKLEGGAHFAVQLVLLLLSQNRLG